MKLKAGFITHSMGDEHVLIPVGEAAEKFRGIARSNETAAFIVDCLKEETTLDEIVGRMCAEYDAPEDRIRTDVGKILDTLRSIGALDE